MGNVSTQTTAQSVNVKDVFHRGVLLQSIAQSVNVKDEIAITSCNISSTHCQLTLVEAVAVA